MYSRSSRSVAVYGSRISKSRPVYGSCPTGGGVAGCIGCEPSVPYITTLIDFIKILNAIKISIERFYNPIFIVTPFTGSIGVKGVIGIAMYTRIQWGKLYKSVYGRFDVNDVVHINLLKDIYLSLGYDWTTDTWLVNWTTNYYNTGSGTTPP